jgi:hypothetical protein
MPIDEQTRNAIALAFTSIVRQGPLNGVVNNQRMSLAIHTLLEHTEPGEPLEGQALFHHLVVDNKAPEAAAIEALVVLKARESTFRGITVELPQQAQGLTPEQRDSIVQAFNARTAAAAPAFEKKDGPPTGSHPPVNPGPSVATPSKRRGDGKLFGIPVKYLAGLGVAGVLFLVSTSYNTATKPPPLVEVKFKADPAGLPCAQPAPPMSNGNARCVIPKALWDKEGEDAIRSRADITKRAVKLDGVTKLWVVTAEDSKIRLAL